jgi:hypothetical protein
MPSKPQKYHRKEVAPTGTYTFDTGLRHRLWIVFYEFNILLFPKFTKFTAAVIDCLQCVDFSLFPHLATATIFDWHL